MAPPTGTLRVGRYFLALLAVLAVLYGIVFWPGTRHTPKLGLDLVGGTQVIFTAKTPNGKTPSSSAMSQAKTIMENRVNGTGVTQSTVVVQGNNQIVVSIPGQTNAQAVAALGKAAVLTMRGNVMPAVVASCLNGVATNPGSSSASPSGSSSATPSSSATGSAGPSATAGQSAAATSAAPKDARVRPLTAPTTPATTPSATPAASHSPSPSPSPSGATTSSGTGSATCAANPLASLGFPVPTTEADYDKLTSAQQQQLQTAVSSVNCRVTNTQPDNAKSYIACEPNTGLAYLLGPAIVQGRQISSASAQAPNIANGQTNWAVNLNLKSSGQAAWANYTAAHNIGGTSANAAPVTQCSKSGTPCADFVGFVLDGQVISAPVNETTINGQTTQITGGFTQKTANTLANQLKYGALPLSFQAQDAQTVSATLGTAQLKAGFLAGGIGLILVVIYSLIYYRALGLVTIASLIVSGGLTYACLVILGTQIGFTLSLAGIAGFIVAVGITADSFVVFFERMKDEVHEGRSARVAIPRAWVRARRTILSADTVSFLAAAILYYFAAGDVKGFAFTLGLSTILDLVVVFLFTHPLVSLLSRMPSFGTARFTGLDAIRGGPAVPDEAPARAAGRPARSRGSAAARGAAPVAVLDRTEQDAPAAPAVSTGDGGDGGEQTEPSGERRHATPAAGTAAERAAQRRARMRQDRQNKGRS